MAKVVIMERSDQAGAFQKVMRTAETESDSFGASGSGPIHEKLRAAYDSFLRGYPDLDPEQCFALGMERPLVERSRSAQGRDPASGRSGRKRNCAVPRIINARRAARRRETNNETRGWNFVKGSARRLCGR